MAWMAWAETDGQRAGDSMDGAVAPPAFMVRDERPTLLMAGPSLIRSPLTDWAGRAGMRCIGESDLDGLTARLARTVSVDFVLLDLRQARLTMGEMAALDPRAALPDADMLILTDLDSVDMALATFDNDRVQILCEPSTGEIIHMLVCAALAAERRAGVARFYDSARPDEDARVAQLCEEVRRLAGTVDRLAQQDMIAGSKVLACEGAAAPSATPAPDEIRALLRARRLRDRFFPADLFADPAWDMMLDLMAARLSGQRVCVSSLCIAAAVPPTTALRWIRQLTERDIFARVDDKTDGRRVFIQLSDTAADAIAAWFGAVRRQGGLLQPVEAG